MSDEISVKAKRTAPDLIPAAAYIRMSGRQQEKSPAEQRAEIVKRAAREGCQIVEWFTDEAVSGDTSSDTRSGLAALLTAAKAGKFKVLLAWHTNRLSREDPMDALVFYNQLRKAGVGLVTCCEGPIDLEDFGKQLLLFVNQKGSHDYLTEHSAKVLRGKIATAGRGGRNGGVLAYGMDRGLFDANDHLVRRLAPGEAVRLPGHTVRTLPTIDATRLDAVRFMFGRYERAAVSFRCLSRELEAHGFPPPPSGRWTPETVAGILRNPVYCGTARFGACTVAKYHCLGGGEIVAVNGNKGKRRQKPQEEWILTPGAFQGIIPMAQFKRVQAKLPTGPKTERRPKAVYPLSGLVFCGHCGKAMTGNRAKYVCTTYLRHGRQNGTGCGKHTIDAGHIERWLVDALRRYYLGPGRAELVEEIKRQLKAEAKTTKTDAKRLEKRAAELEREVSRLVKAIRTTDAPELVEALDTARTERQSVQDALQHAARWQDGQSIDQEAESVADELGRLDEGLSGDDPALVREVFRRLVDRIECRWEAVPNGGKGTRPSHRLTGGVVYLRDPLVAVTCANHAKA
jgi:site-specific DNA recombinase